jgi:hypothetical protein
MNFFDEATLRLKQQLKVTEDKQAAEALGLTGNAWTMRKRRSAFPEKELRALAQQRPELGLDVEYVLTGVWLSGHERQAIDHARRFTAELPGLNDAERERLMGMADAAGVRAARDSLGAGDTAYAIPGKRRVLQPGRLRCETDGEDLLLDAYRVADDQGKAALLLAARALAAFAQSGDAARGGQWRKP